MSPFNRAAWEGRAPLTAPPPAPELVADVRMLDIGWEVWSCRRVDADIQALGGVITAILGPAKSHDAETGER